MQHLLCNGDDIYSGWISLILCLVSANSLMLVLLSLMLEPEMGCGYGKVSHFGILCSVHLESMEWWLWAFISSALKCFIMHLQRFTPVKGSLENVTRLSVCDYFLPQALVVTGYLQASSTSLLRSLLLQGVQCPSETESSPSEEVSTKATVLSERATTILRQIVWTFQHVIDKQERKPDLTTFRWRVILQGIPLPAHAHRHTVAIHQHYDQLVYFKRILIYSDFKIRSATQAMRNEDNWSTAEDHDAYKTLNGKKLSSFLMKNQSFATPRYSATPCYVAIQVPNVIDTISKRWRSKKAFILHLPTSFPKQILTPSRFKFILLINNGIGWKIMMHLLSGLKNSVGV